MKKTILVSFFAIVAMCAANAQIDSSLIDRENPVDMSQNISKNFEGSMNDSLWVKAQIEVAVKNIDDYTNAALLNNKSIRLWVLRLRELEGQLEKIRKGEYEKE